MGHALNAPAMVRFDWNHETIVADRDELILDRFRRTTHQSFERARDTRTQHRDLVTNTRELRTRTIVELSARQNFVRDARNECVEIAWQVFYQLPQHWSVLTFCKNGGARRHRLIAETRSLQNRERIETRAFDT